MPLPESVLKNTREMLVRMQGCVKQLDESIQYTEHQLAEERVRREDLQAEIKAVQGWLKEQEQ